MMKLKMMASAALVAGLTYGSAAHAGPNPLIGEVQLTAATYCPRDFAQTDGQLESINNNPTLFSIIGNFYGGDGYNTMGMPDLRGRTAVNHNTGVGLSPIPFAFEAGLPAHYLLESHMPTHSHGISVTSGSNTHPEPNNRLLPTFGGAGRYYNGASPSTVFMTAQTSNEGGTQPHSSVQPTLGVRHCIALDGTYPSRN